VRSRKGDRRVIEAISKELGDCLETNLYAIPTKKARDLTAKDRESPIIEYLFRAIRPNVVFVYSAEPIAFFEKATGCRGFTEEVRRAEWPWPWNFCSSGDVDPLYTMSDVDAIALGKRLASRLDRKPRKNR
jgi:hypothetical protein